MLRSDFQGRGRVAITWRLLSSRRPHEAAAIARGQAAQSFRCSCPERLTMPSSGGHPLCMVPFNIRGARSSVPPQVLMEGHGHR